MIASNRSILTYVTRAVLWAVSQKEQRQWYKELEGNYGHVLCRVPQPTNETVFVASTLMQLKPLQTQLGIILPNRLEKVFEC